MYKGIRNFCRQSLLIVLMFTAPVAVFAQQTLGGLTGLVTDAGGAILPGTTVTVVSDQTGLKRVQTSGSNGVYAFQDLPIGTYTVTFSHDGFQKSNFPGIPVQADRTATINAGLTVGSVDTSVNVDAVPLMNAVDITNGYVLDKEQIESIPLPTGSVLGAAILSPGVNAELPSGTGANDGLGNPPIWANGQRDTSNSFSLNGVDGSNLFNGKSTSSVGSARVVNSTGTGGTQGGGVIQSSASVYLAIGNAIPSPAPETIQELRVNASLYDAQQGSTSGAHIDASTSTGTNSFHGSLYGRRGTNWLNAAPFFFKQDGTIPDNKKNPGLHRYVAGGTFGGPIIKDKLFGFVAYQHLHVADEQIGDSFLAVPVGLSDDRSAATLASIVNTQYGSTIGQEGSLGVDPIALALFNSPALPGEPGKYLIPNDTSSGTLSPAQHADAFLPGTGRFHADMAVANLDYNATSKDTLSVKYYYQHDPNAAPYAYSSVPGFTQRLDAGSQVFAISNTYLVKPNLSTQTTLGFIREKAYSKNDQPFGPSNIPNGSGGTVTIDEFGSNYFPGVSIINVLGSTGQNAGAGSGILNIGPNAEAQGSNTGVFQNRIQPSGTAIWALGKHSVAFGGSYSYTQLNTIDKRPGTGTVVSDDLSQFMQGFVTPGGSTADFFVSSFLQGNASRYYRANQLGLFVQDKFQVRPNLSLTAGVRYDWDGGFNEKYGRIFNFDAPDPAHPSDPNAYHYTDSTDTIDNPGFIIAGNNTNGTKGVSKTTLTGRQWGIAPRVGAAWQPTMFHDKVVVRSGAGIYYDRGELFSYFSPGYAIGTVTGGPFGVNQQLPFVTAQTCLSTAAGAAGETFYEGFLPTCGGTDVTGDLAHPYGNQQTAYPANPKSSDLRNYLPNLAGIENFGQPISLGVYDRKNKLPYTVNYTLDIQWQPRNDIAIELGYVGNLGRHQVIPVPFNQPNIASPGNPIHGETATYGYTVGGGTTLNGVEGGPTYRADYEGGNVDHRVPYVGYAAESIDYKAAGVDAYNALQAHIEKRMSHGFQIGASYTYSHALDEQSGLGLFYNGNNPLNLRDGYASSDFDRTHVINFNYIYRAPDFFRKESLAGKFADGWSLVGLTVLQSGQPYSVIDYSGAVGSIYYSTADGITNPIVPLAPGCTAKSAKTGSSGAFTQGTGAPALKNTCFTIPLLAAGGLNGAIPATDPFETSFTSGQRNIFRQSFQKRADASLLKETNLSERYKLKYTFDVYNLTNTTSFDIPGDNVDQNAYFNAFANPIGSYTVGVAPSAQSCSTPDGVADSQPYTGKYFYSCPSGLGVTTHAIGSSRQIQMSLAFQF